jgi:hypothetical protein
MDEVSPPLSTHDVEISTESLYSSFVPRSLSFVSLGAEFVTSATEEHIPIWRKPVRHRDANFLWEETTYLNTLQRLGCEPLETVDPRLLTRDVSEEIEYIDDLKGSQVGSSREFPKTIADELLNDEENKTSIDAEIAAVMELARLEWFATDEFSFPNLYGSTISSDPDNTNAINVDEVLKETPTRDLTPYLTTPPKTISHLRSPSRSSSISPRITAILTPNNPPSPPPSITSARTGTRHFNAPVSPQNNASHVSVNKLSPEADERLWKDSIQTFKSQLDTTNSESEEEYRPRELSSSLSPAPSNFQRRTPLPPKIFHSVTVERPPRPAVKEKPVPDISQRSQVPETTSPEAMQRVLPLEEEEGKWLPGAGKSPKSLGLLRRKMKRKYSEVIGY